MIVDTVRRGYSAPAGGPPGDFDNVWNAEVVITLNENGPKEWVNDLQFENNSTIGNGFETYSGVETITLAEGGSIDIPGKNFRPSRYHYGQKKLVNSHRINLPMTVVGLLNKGNHVNGDTWNRPSNGSGNQKLSWRPAASAVIEVETQGLYAVKSPCPGNGWRWLYYYLPTTAGVDVVVKFDGDAPVPHSSGGVGTASYYDLLFPFGIEGVAFNFTDSTSYLLYFARELSQADYNDIKANPWKPWGGVTPSW